MNQTRCIEIVATLAKLRLSTEFSPGTFDLNDSVETLDALIRHAREAIEGVKTAAVS